MSRFSRSRSGYAAYIFEKDNGGLAIHHVDHVNTGLLSPQVHFGGIPEHAEKINLSRPFNFSARFLL